MEKRKFFAVITYGISDNVPSDSLLPDDFTYAHRLYSKGKMEDACEVLSKYLSCSFNPENVLGDLTEIINIKHQTESIKVKIWRLRYNNSIFPIVNATAEFEFHSTKNLSSSKIEAWEFLNDELYNGINFWWNLEIDEEDFSLDHQGLSFEINA